MESLSAPSRPQLSGAAALRCERSEPADDELAREAQAGGAAALEMLAQRYRGRIYVFALAVLQRPDDAEDVAQETCIRAFRGLPAYERRGHFRSWLFGIAANVCREHRRSQRRYAGVELVEEATVEDLQTPDVAIRYEQAALKAAVREAIARLPAVYRAPVVLYYLEELSVAEVAAALGHSPSAVKMRLWRARALLARALADRLD